MAMSEHFGAQRDARRALCGRFAPLLAALDHADTARSTDTPEMAEARAHLATCPYCQADQRDYAALDGAVRATFGPVTAAPFRTADLLMAIGATSEPRRAGDPIRSVRYVKDFEDTEGQTMTPNTDERAPDGAAPAALLAAQPDSRPLRRQALTLSFSATAAAVVLIVIVVSLFGVHWRLTGTHTTAKPIANARGQVFLPGYSTLVAISMDSPTDGWALGDATPQSGSGGIAAAGFYHFDGVHWRLAQRISGVNITGVNSATLTMFSHSNGWAYDGLGSVFQYDGARWQSVAVNLPGGEHASHVLTLDMLSSTEGWASAYITSAGGVANIGFLHYANQQWTAELAPTVLPGLDNANLTITGISALPRGDVWAVGFAPIYRATGMPTSTVALVFHRVAGVWQIASRLNAPAMNGMLAPRDIYMSSATSGWMVGDISTNHPNSEGYSTIKHALLMRYDGAQWTQVSVPLTLPTNGDSLFHLMATEPDNIWVALQTTTGLVTPKGLEVIGGFLHYDGATWSEVTPIPSVERITMIHHMNYTIAPDGAIWSVGNAEDGQSTQKTSGLFVCSLKNGAWSVSTFAASK